MAISSAERSHPLVRALGEAARELTLAADVPLWSLSAAELRELTVKLSQLASAVGGVEATVLAQAERSDVAAAAGATSTATWLAQATHLTRAAAHGRVRLAKALDGRPATASALGEGRLLVEQARVILDAVQAVEDIPTDIAETRGLDVATLADAAEARLLEEAVHHDAKALKVLGRRILDVVAPEVAEEHERRLLEAEERRARERTRFTMSEDGHGLVHGRFAIPALQAAMLRKALLALAAPKHQAGTGGYVPGRPSPQRMGAAFCEYIERYPDDRLPHAGGTSATVVVTIGLDQLRDALGAGGAGVLDDHGRISATETRRLACEAGIIPTVLGGAGQVLDVGRRRRFHTEPQRHALAIRDGGCTADGCDWPPGLCHAHHDIAWSRGGDTSVANGRLLCPRHHTMAHDPGYTTTRLGTGKLRFTRRT